MVAVLGDAVRGVVGGDHRAGGRRRVEDNVAGSVGHVGHGLATFGKGKIIDFYANYAFERCGGHSAFGWMEYRISTDAGKTFSLISHVDYPDRHIDEHMLVEMKDGQLMMLVRAKHGIGQSFSGDGGETWAPATDSGLGGPCSRFHIRRLKNGKWLLINHYNFKRRDHLTAMLSDDDGLTWKGFLVLDERSDVSYPDAVETEDGTIYVIYDRERYDAREILMAKITQDDILQGTLVTPASRLKIVLNRATGEKV